MDYDVILVGGGLANSLIAWKLAVEQPSLRVLLIEQADRLGGNHTWCFYHHDLTEAQRDFLAPVIAHRWPGYDVHFPQYRRRLDTPYYAVASQKLHEVIAPIMGENIRFDTVISEIDNNAVIIGTARITAHTIIDGRGFKSSAHMHYAYQKFVGLEVTLQQPHGQDLPVIMDANVAQEDGFRFVYTLPLDTHCILIEDTYYSDDKTLDEARLSENIYRYAAAKNWAIDHVVRQEKGILPITLSGDIRRFWDDAHLAAVPSGLRAHLFHQTTGYSLLYAVRLADRLAKADLRDAYAIKRLVRQFGRDQWLQQWFYRVLNRMLFYAAEPVHRYRLLQRFYTLKQPLIERFYAGDLRLFDKLRLVYGRPPVPIIKAVKAILTFGRKNS